MMSPTNEYRNWKSTAHKVLVKPVYIKLIKDNNNQPDVTSYQVCIVTFKRVKIMVDELSLQ